MCQWTLIVQQITGTVQGPAPHEILTFVIIYQLFPYYVRITNSPDNIVGNECGLRNLGGFHGNHFKANTWNNHSINILFSDNIKCIGPNGHWLKWNLFSHITGELSDYANEWKIIICLLCINLTLRLPVEKNYLLTVHGSRWLPPFLIAIHHLKMLHTSTNCVAYFTYLYQNV